MTDTTIYWIPDSILAAHLEGEAVLLEMETKQYFRLNDTGALIWKALERRATMAEIVRDLCEAFEVDPEEAAAEVERLLAELSGAGLVRAGAAG